MSGHEATPKMIAEFEMLERMYKDWLNETLKKPICMKQTNPQDLHDTVALFVEHVIDADLSLSFGTYKEICHEVWEELDEMDIYNAIELPFDLWYLKKLKLEDWDALLKIEFKI